MAEQVTDKIERILQEVPYADKIRSYQARRIVDLVAGAWLVSRKKSQPLVPKRGKGGRHAPQFLPLKGYMAHSSTMSSVTCTVIYALEWRRLLRRESASTPSRCFSAFAWFHPFQRLKLFGVQPEKSISRFLSTVWRELGLDMNQLMGNSTPRMASKAAASL